MKKYSIIIITLLSVIAVALFFLSGSSIKVSAVPFGLPAGTKISIGVKAKFPNMPSPAEADLQRANDLRAAGAFRAAQDNYETILLKYPNLPAALYGVAYSMLAEDLVSAETLAKAKSIIENLALQMPGSVWVQLLLTFSREHDGNINQALNMAANLAAASPAFSEARLRYADLLLKTGLLERAVKEAKAAISISAGSEVRAYVLLASAWHKMGNLDECSELVNYALQRFPSQTDLLLLHGYLSEYSRNFDKAQDNYKKILALKPGDANAQYAMATLGEKTPPIAGATVSAAGGISLKDQAREAAKIIIPLIEEYPENLPLREALGKIYLKARLMKEARTQFSEIHAQDFDYPNIKKLLEEASEEQPRIILSPAVSSQNNKNLADSLAKTFAVLRENKNFKNNDYDELGRYFVHYGATFKDFFSKYSITRYKKLDEKTFIEKYAMGQFIYENTVFFDKKKNFYATRIIISDTAKINSPNYIPDLFRPFLKKLSGILGESLVSETTECNGEIWESVTWLSIDNFEILMYNPKIPRRIYIIRMHAKRFPNIGSPCNYVNMAMGKSRMLN